MRQLLQAHGLCREKVSLDALPCKPLTLEPRAEAGGIYLVGLKEKQPALWAEVKQATEHLACLYHSEKVATREKRVAEVSNL